MAGRSGGYNGLVGYQPDGTMAERLPRLEAGLVTLPPSKSQVLRVLMVAAGGSRRVVLSYGHGRGWEEAGEDIRRGMDCARALGSLVRVDGADCALGPGGEDAVGGSLPVGEAGFLGRVAPVCAALARAGRWEVSAAGSLRGRSSPALWACLRGGGVAVDEGEGWLDGVSGDGAQGPWELNGASSSQELSALWIGLACRGGGDVRVVGAVPSEPYLDLTRAVLALFGAEVQEEAEVYRVSAADMDPAEVLVAEVDASAAAVALAAGCLGGVRLEVPGPALGTAQGDWRIVEHLRAFGCEIESSGGKLICAGGPVRGAELDLSGEPDLAPVLAAVAAGAAYVGGGESVLSGLQTLDGKESRRGEVLERGLRAAGFSCVWKDPLLRVGGEGVGSGEVVLEAEGDHRMAFAFALLGVFLPGVWVGGGCCTTKSWPHFWSAMAPNDAGLHRVR